MSDKELSAEETRKWMRRYGWLDKDGRAYPASAGGATRCVKDCVHRFHDPKNETYICVLGPSHTGEPHCCLDCFERTGSK